MLIKKLTLKNFRNYKSREFSFEEGDNIIIGPNGVGKTNILEAVYVLNQGKSWRTRYDHELVNLNSETANIKARVNSTELFIGIQRTQSNRTKKVTKVDGVNRTQKKFTSHTKSIIFSPQDLEIIIGSPSNRRNFLNETLTQVDDKYKDCLLALKKTTRSRNKLLKRINEGLANYSEIEYWNKTLIKNSEYIHKQRYKLINFLNTYLQANFSNVSNTGNEVFIKYDHSVANEERLKEYKDAEINSKRTLVGAHKDDLLVSIGESGESPDFSAKQEGVEREARYFASRGEQRTIAFMLKLASLKYLQDELDTGIILLLDDIYSELDEFHRKAVSEYFKDNQVLITTAEERLVPEDLLRNAKVITLE